VAANSGSRSRGYYHPGENYEPLSHSLEIIAFGNDSKLKQPNRGRSGFPHYRGGAGFGGSLSENQTPHAGPHDALLFSKGDLFEAGAGPMILRSEKTQTEFELRLLGYQFPEILHDVYDSNWLLANIRVNAPTGSWSATDPCLLTWEGHWLLNWLADLVSARESQVEMSFLESNLSFVLTHRRYDEVDVNIELQDKLRQPPAITGGAGSKISLSISLCALREAVQSLCRELQLFPLRAGVMRRCRPYSDPEDACLLCADKVR
jgi:hypothetical protein